MASSIRQAAIRSPGFFGLNTEHSAANTKQRWATILENAIFDEAGKISARKGCQTLADSGPTTVDRVYWWRKDKDTEYLLAAGNDSGTRRLYNMTTVSTEYDTFTQLGTTTTTDVLFINVNGQVVVLEQDEAPLVWDSTGSFASIAVATGTTANPSGGIGMSAFGRLFVTDADRQVLLGSELQPDPKTTGINWDNWYIDTRGASGGSAKDGWTIGKDFITAVASLQDYLIIFGLSNILIYSGVNGTPVLEDSISGVGCVNQHTVQHTGNDILFLSATGVRSLRRTMENETAELNDVSAFVRTSLLDDLNPDNCSAAYSPQDGFYILSDGAETYYFDTKQTMEGGALRASKWSLYFAAATYDTANSRLFLAHDALVAEYADYDDHGNSYKLTLKSAWIDFGNSDLKIAKKLSAIIADGDGYTPRFSLAFDFDGEQEEFIFAEVLPILIGSEWNIAEWGLGEWGGYIEKTNKRSVQAFGTGQFVRYGLEFIVNGYGVGILELALTAKMGRLAHV